MSNLTDQLALVIPKIVATVSSAGDFVLDQLPDIAQSYIMYGRAQTLVYFLLFIAALVGSIYTITYGVRISKDINNDTDAFPFIFCGAIGSLIFGTGVLISIEGVLLSWFAPKIWLIKQLLLLAKTLT